MRLVYLFLGLAAVFLGGWWIFGSGFEELGAAGGGFRGWMAGGGREWGWLVGIGLLTADLILPVPGTLVMSALGYVYGPFMGGLLAGIGSILAGLTGYGLGRLVGVGRARRFLGEKDFERGKELFVHRGGWMVAMSRAIPILPEVISCVAGLMAMPFRRYLIALACGSIPMGFLFAMIGATGVDHPEVAIGLSIAIPGLLWMISRKFRMSG